jgi:DNA polymerase-4
MMRSIVHINIIHFYVAVARMLEPKLSGYPVGVRAAGSRRILGDVSDEAIVAGVYRGMPLEAAKRKCPDLRVTDPVPAQYSRVEQFLLKQASQLTPLAETAGPGHLFLDLTGTDRLHGPAVDTADSVRKLIKRECSIDCAVGLAENRLVSKIATRVIKPAGLCTVLNGCEEDFMAPLPVSFLPGLEKRLLEQILQFNLRLIKDLIHIPLGSLLSVLGPSAHEIHRQARGIDDTPVREIEKPAPSVCETLTFGEQTNDEYEIACALFGLVSSAGAQVRKMGLAVQSIRLHLTYSDGGEASKRITLPVPIRGDLSLYEHCASLLQKIRVRRVRIAELGIGFHDLTFPYGQVDLFSDNEKEEHLMDAIDSIRNNYGNNAIRFWGRQVA